MSTEDTTGQVTQRETKPATRGKSATSYLATDKCTGGRLVNLVTGEIYPKVGVPVVPMGGTEDWVKAQVKAGLLQKAKPMATSGK